MKKKVNKRSKNNPENKSRQNYTFWVFSNIWYYLFPMIWFLLVMLIELFSTGNLLPIRVIKDLSLFSATIFIVTYYLIWQIPFFIYWFIRVRKK